MGQCSELSNIQPTDIIVDIIGIGGQLRDESAKGEWVWRIWVRMQKNCSSNYGLSLNVLCPIKELNLLVIFLFNDFEEEKQIRALLFSEHCHKLSNPSHFKLLLIFFKSWLLSLQHSIFIIFSINFYPSHSYFTAVSPGLLPL